MDKRRIIVATRKSELALAQCRQFLNKLVACHPHVSVEELHVVTTGDQITDRPLASIGGKGLFLKEIEEKLLSGEADIAVHSMKDVPPEIHPELCLACVPEREDPRDVLVTRSKENLANLRKGAVVGTSSLRRAVQLTMLRPDLQVVPIRGNVGTRIKKCAAGEVDATVLAQAGLNRLGINVGAGAELGMETLSTDVCLPAVGQGALVIEIRKRDVDLLGLLQQLEHPDTALITAAERGVMTSVEGDCKTPVASFGERKGGVLRLRAFLAEPDGSRPRRVERTVPFPSERGAAHQLGLELGLELKHS